MAVPFLFLIASSLQARPHLRMSLMGKLHPAWFSGRPFRAQPPPPPFSPPDISGLSPLSAAVVVVHCSTGAARGCPRFCSRCGQGHARPACGVAVLFTVSWPGVQGQRGRATTGTVPSPVAGQPKPPLTAAAAHRTLPPLSLIHLPHCVRGDRWQAGVCLRPGPPSLPCATRAVPTD